MSKIYQFYLELLKKYGKPAGLWEKWCKRKKNIQEKEEIVLGAILTQRANWKNVELALENLKLAQVLSLKRIYQIGKKNLKLLERLIRPSGFYQQKAQRLFQFSKFIIENYGSLDKFFKQDLEIAREELFHLPGIGPETADSILLYAGQKPVFVIDEYTRRLVKKYNLSKNFSYYRLQDLFEKNLPKDVKIYQDFHALIVIAGKEAKISNENSS